MYPQDYLPLTCEQMSLFIHNKPCLSAIDFSIKTQGVTVIMGDNGSGKTLLLNLCAGILSPTKGTIRWASEVTPPYLTLAPQQAVLLRSNVRQNIEKPLIYHRVKNHQQQCQRALEWAGITHLEHQQAQHLSTGEQQLVALARAWALQPGILLLDEPTANLDPGRRQTIEALIKSLSQHCKIILSTHSIKQARELAEDIILLERGKLLTHSIATEFFSTEAFHQFSGNR